MILILTPRFKRDYKKLPQNIQKQTDRKLGILEEDIFYPSLRVERVKKYSDIFEGSVTMKYRFFFRIKTGAYILLRIGKHDMLKKR